MDITESINDYKTFIEYLNTKHPEIVSKSILEFEELDKLFAALCLYIPSGSTFLKFKEPFVINQTTVVGLQYYHKGGLQLDRWNTTVIAKTETGFLYEEPIQYSSGVIRILLKQLETNI